MYCHNTNSSLRLCPVNHSQQTNAKSHFRYNYLRTFNSLGTARVRSTISIKTMSQTSTCTLREEQRLNCQDKEWKSGWSLETRVTEGVTLVYCKGRIAYGIEAAALSGEIAELAPQTGRIVIDLSGVEMIDAAGLGELVSVAVAAQASGCSITLAAPGDFIRRVLTLTNLTSVLEVHPTLDAATLAFHAQMAQRNSTRVASR